MFIEQVLKGTDLTKSRKAMIAFKEIVRNEAGDQCSLGKPDYVCSDDFWELCNTNGLGCNSEDTTAKDMCIDIDISI